MTAEKAEMNPETAEAMRVFYDDLEALYEKRLGRLKLVEDELIMALDFMMYPEARQHVINGNEELQSVIAEIEREMKG